MPRLTTDLDRVHDCGDLSIEVKDQKVSRHLAATDHPVSVRRNSELDKHVIHTVQAQQIHVFVT
tara:strand:- start:87 stop:278 length:192 start_codon:yes stop_codon:yes gene_type:complete